MPPIAGVCRLFSPRQPGFRSRCFTVFITVLLAALPVQAAWAQQTAEDTVETRQQALPETADTTKAEQKGRTVVRIAPGEDISNARAQAQKEQADSETFSDTGPWSIPDEGSEARYFKSDDFAPSGATVTKVEYKLRIAPQNDPKNFCADDYAIYISSSEKKEAPADALVFIDPNSCPDGGTDDDSANDRDIELDWRSTNEFDGESANQYWGTRIRDRYPEDKGQLEYIKLRIHWQSAAPSPPELISPGNADESNSQSIETLTPTFRWDEVSGADKYGLYISKEPYGAENLVYQNEDLNGDSFTIPSDEKLEKGTKYRWNMRTYSDGQWSDYSDRLYFQTKSPPEISVSPGEGTYSFGKVTVGNSKTKDFTVENTGGGTLNVEPSLTGSDTDQFSITNGASLSLGSGEKYTFDIEYAPNEAGTHQVDFELEHSGENIGSPWTATLGGEGVLPPPELVSPGNENLPGPTLSETRQTFQWESVSGADKYGLYVEDRKTGDLVVNTESISSGKTSYEIELKAGRRYKWDMQAFANGEASDFSEEYYFQIEKSSPDLVFSEFVSVEPSTVDAGKKVTVTFTVKNKGDAQAKSSTTRIRLNTNPDKVTRSNSVKLKDLSTSALAAGKSQSYDTQVTIPSGTEAGDYYVWVILDVNSTAGQSDESNDKDNTELAVNNDENGGGPVALSFPLPKHEPSSAKITAVFDHTISNNDGVVHAYTGEKGKEKYGKKKVGTVNGKILYGYKKDEEGSPFNINGNYESKENYLYYEGHDGYDYKTKNNQNNNGNIRVLAAAEGNVIKVIREDEGYGNRVLIGHKNKKYRTLYAHLSSISVEKGEEVVRKQKVGVSGHTGDVTGPHLHFEVRRNTRNGWAPVDPYGWEGTPGEDPYPYPSSNSKNDALWKGSSSPPAEACPDDPPVGENPSFSEISACIDDLAEKYKVPGIIIRALLQQENGPGVDHRAWAQFETDNSPLISSDGGIGLTQITVTSENTSGINVVLPLASIKEGRKQGRNPFTTVVNESEEAKIERLKKNWVYNIKIGIRHLLAKKAGVPENGTGEPGSKNKILENWYNALAYYNGYSAYTIKDYPTKNSYCPQNPNEDIGNKCGNDPGFPYTRDGYKYGWTNKQFFTYQEAIFNTVAQQYSISDRQDKGFPNQGVKVTLPGPAAVSSSDAGGYDFVWDEYSKDYEENRGSKWLDFYIDQNQGYARKSTNCEGNTFEATSDCDWSSSVPITVHRVENFSDHDAASIGESPQQITLDLGLNGISLSEEPDASSMAEVLTTSQTAATSKSNASAAGIFEYVFWLGKDGTIEYGHINDVDPKAKRGYFVFVKGDEPVTISYSGNSVEPALSLHRTMNMAGPTNRTPFASNDHVYPSAFYINDNGKVQSVNLQNEALNPGTAYFLAADEETRLTPKGHSSSAAATSSRTDLKERSAGRAEVKRVVRRVESRLRQLRDTSAAAGTSRPSGVSSKGAKECKTNAENSFKLCFSVQQELSDGSVSTVNLEAATRQDATDGWEDETDELQTIAIPGAPHAYFDEGYGLQRSVKPIGQDVVEWPMLVESASTSLTNGENTNPVQLSWNVSQIPDQKRAQLLDGDGNVLVQNMREKTELSLSVSDPATQWRFRIRLMRQVNASITGRVRYPRTDKEGSLVQGAKVTVSSEGGKTVATTKTGAEGSYSVQVGEGTYEVTVTDVSQKKPTGIDIADAFSVQQFWLGDTEFSSFQQALADVDASGKANTSDAFDIERYWLEEISSFEAGKHYSATKSVSVSGQDKTANLRVAAYGDAELNGGFGSAGSSSSALTINFLSASSKSGTETNGKSGRASATASPGSTFEVPILAGGRATIGAYQLSFDYPVEKVRFKAATAPNSEVQAHSKGGAVRLGWFDRSGGREPVSLGPGEVLVTLTFKTKKEVEKGGSFRLKDVRGKLIGPDGRVLPGVALEIPKVRLRGSPESFALRGNVPNPFHRRTAVLVDMPSEGTVTIEIYNTLGQRVKTVRREVGVGRSRRIEVERRGLGSGVYLYRVRATVGGKTVRKTGRMTVTR